MSGKGGSRWGSLLSGAVAGLESRLDTILAEDDQASARARAAEEKAKLEAAEKTTAEKNKLQADQGGWNIFHRRWEVHVMQSGYYLISNRKGILNTE